MSLISTYLQDIRVMYPSNLDRDELRRTQNGLLEAVIQMTNSGSSIISPDLVEKAKTSQGLEMDVPVMKKGNVTIGNVRSCTIGGGQSDSALVRLVWKTITADIMMVPQQYEKNQVKYLYDLNKKIGDIVEAFKVEIEEDLDLTLDTAKTQVFGSTIPTTDYTVVGNAIQVPVAQQDFFFNDLDAINFADDFYNPEMIIIGSHSVMPVVRKFINQGSANDENTAFQFAGKNFMFSNRVTNGVGKKGTAYFMPDGSVGFVTRVDGDARMGAKATDGTEWSEESLPGLPFTVGIQYKSKCDDKSLLEASGLAHLKATLVEHWQISVDYAILTPYNQDPATYAGAIRKFEFVP